MGATTSGTMTVLHTVLHTCGHEQGYQASPSLERRAESAARLSGCLCPLDRLEAAGVVFADRAVVRCCRDLATAR